jgi:hypothetical protein
VGQRISIPESQVRIAVWFGCGSQFTVARRVSHIRSRRLHLQLVVPEFRRRTVAEAHNAHKLASIELDTLHVANLASVWITSIQNAHALASA